MNEATPKRIALAAALTLALFPWAPARAAQDDAPATQPTPSAAPGKDAAAAAPAEASAETAPQETAALAAKAGEQGAPDETAAPAEAPVRLEPPLPERNFSEAIDAFFKPAVDTVASVFFWDPFAALGLFDPVVRDDAGKPIRDPVSGEPYTRAVPLVVAWLVFGAIFFTIFMRFINLRGFGHAIELVRGLYDRPEDHGEVSHFKALATALSATVGLGNIAGVAVAISTGGPGATFWMIVAGLLGMSSKFTECTLGVKYREIDAEGNVSGGAMYYLSKGLGARGGLWKPTGKTLAVLFAILCVGGSFGGGNMFQANQAFKQMASLFPALSEWGWAFGMAVAILVGLVIIGGIQSIARVTSVIVPFMCGMYVVVALVIIFMNLPHIGEAFGAIFAGAFSAKAMYGGFLGVVVQGFKRAAFSNEAGIGSAAIAHSAAKTDEPISEGIVALLEPFIDTVVVCTMTALVIVFTGAYEQNGLEGAQLTSYAFGTVFSWFPYLLGLAAFLFAFSTMISWSYYGLKAWSYLFGGNRTAELIYKVLFLFCVVIGAASSLGAVLDFSDMMILGMAFPNILGLLILSKEVRGDLDSYWRRLKAGEIKRYA